MKKQNICKKMLPFALELFTLLILVVVISFIFPGIKIAAVSAATAYSIFKIFKLIQKSRDNNHVE